MPLQAMSWDQNDRLSLNCTGEDESLGRLELGLVHWKKTKLSRVGNLKVSYEMGDVVLRGLAQNGFADAEEKISGEASSSPASADTGPMTIHLPKKHLLHVNFELTSKKELRLIMDLEVSHWRYDDDGGPWVSVFFEFRRRDDSVVWPRTAADFRLKCSTWGL